MTNNHRIYEKKKKDIKKALKIIQKETEKLTNEKVPAEIVEVLIFCKNGHTIKLGLLDSFQLFFAVETAKVHIYNEIARRFHEQQHADMFPPIPKKDRGVG